MKPNEYQCAMCGNIYEKEMTEEEAYNECVDNFGKEMADHAEMDVICDDCYKKIMPSEHPDKVAAAQKEFYESRQ